MSSRRESDRADYTLYGTLPVSIKTPPDVVSSVVQYFWPHCEETRDRPPVAIINLATHATAAQQRATGAGERIALYEAPDGHVPDYNTGELWHVDSRVRVVRNPHTGTHFTIAGNQVDVRNQEIAWGMVDLCRVIKQLVATHYESLGQCVLHAAAVEYKGTAILFVGPKASGKTTLVQAALMAGARFVTNDRLFVDAAGPLWSVRGWSDPMRLVDSLGEKKRLVPLHSYFNGDLSLVSREQTPVGMVIFPDLGRSATETRVMPLDIDRGLELLTQQILPVRQRWLGIEPDATPTARVAPHCPFVSVSAYYYEAADAFAQALDTLHKPLGTATR